MDTNVIFWSGLFVSCLINSVMLFQFIEERYERVYNNSKALYYIIKIMACIVMFTINLVDYPFVKLASWILMFSIIIIKFYYNGTKKILNQVFEILVLILVLSICETVGIVILEFIFSKSELHNIRPDMRISLKTTFSSLVMLFFYYTVIIKLWREDKPIKFTASQYFVHTIITVYSLANLAVIVSVISKLTNDNERFLLLINMGCIVFADFYFLYFVKFVEENNQLKMKLQLLEQQSALQYEYYASQEKKYNESVKILHDINKHIKMIEDLYEAREEEKALSYTREILRLLEPLAPREYTNHPILNILLDDKKECASNHNIEFALEVGNVDLKFMEPMEITTIFGNLLDNAIEACNKVSQNRFIEMKIDTFHDFVAIHIENSSEEIEKWAHGKPVSKKGNNHGIGLINVENVIKKYNGNMMLQAEQGTFSCDIIFNS